MGKGGGRGGRSPPLLITEFNLTTPVATFKIHSIAVKVCERQPYPRKQILVDRDRVTALRFKNDIIAECDT